MENQYADSSMWKWNEITGEFGLVGYCCCRGCNLYNDASDANKINTGHCSACVCYDCVCPMRREKKLYSENVILPNKGKKDEWSCYCFNCYPDDTKFPYDTACVLLITVVSALVICLAVYGPGIKF
jgi:hypothetical protein